MTGKIVEHALKIDLHIHSAASKHKDGNKVSLGTPENLDVLIKGLERYDINMVAITDHDVFDFELYEKLCDKASQSTCIEKVFPGVEFTVVFNGDNGPKPVHIITIFNDSDRERLRAISDLIPMNNGKPEYDCAQGFSENTYWDIIRSIGLDVVTIAHQKTTPSSSSPRKNDANSVGEKLFNELLFFEYFEAYEYRNQRNELFNNVWRVSNLKPEQQEAVRFITGSDCHLWSAYPDCDTSNQTEFKHTYLKCLPTFRGLAMAVTDISRIRTVDNFYDKSAYVLDKLILKVAKTKKAKEGTLIVKTKGGEISSAILSQKKGGIF